MKFRILILTVIILFLNGLVCSGTILIVDNHFPTPAGEYATIKLAYDVASSGDTLLLTPSEGIYDGITATKPINIIGNGWARPSSSVPNTKTYGFTFNDGSAGSSITGCEVVGAFDIYTSNITVKRNKCQYINVRANCADVVIMQNFIIADRYCCNWFETSIIVIWENTKVFISNNVIINTRYGSYAQYAIYTSYPSNLVVCNNIIKAEDGSIFFSMSGGTYITHSVFNNIILGGGISGVAASFNNMANSTQFPATDSNLQNVDMNTVFADAANSDYHIKEGSPAIGAGFKGTDCGIYGGDFGFVDKGAPWLPIVYELDVPVMVNKKDGLNVTVKAKSGN